MADAEITAAARSDVDNPPLTETELARLRRGGRPPLPERERKLQVTLRLPRPVVEHFRKGGPGWQTRIGEALARIVHRK